MAKFAREDERGALWKKTSAAGRVYFTGNVGDEKVVAFLNRDKRNPNEPDLRIYKQQPRDGEPRRPWPPGTHDDPVLDGPLDPPTEDDIPF